MTHTPDISSLANRQKKLFTFLEKVADGNLPCPTNQDLLIANLTPSLLSGLARAGYITTTLYAGNIRMVTIRVGPHQGKSTAEPKGLAVIRTIDLDTEALRPHTQPGSLEIPDWT